MDHHPSVNNSNNLTESLPNHLNRWWCWPPRVSCGSDGGGFFDGIGDLVRLVWSGRRTIGGCGGTVSASLSGTQAATVDAPTGQPQRAKTDGVVTGNDPEQRDLGSGFSHAEDHPTTIRGLTDRRPGHTHRCVGGTTRDCCGGTGPRSTNHLKAVSTIRGMQVKREPPTELRWRVPFLICEQSNKLSFWPNWGWENPGVKGNTERLKN